MVDIHYPSNEMMCGSKISCISWNPYHKSTLSSSDYDCSVIVWDVATGQKVKVFQEHEKRCWSVDFNNRDPKLLASGVYISFYNLYMQSQSKSVVMIAPRWSPDDSP